MPTRPAMRWGKSIWVGSINLHCLQSLIIHNQSERRAGRFRRPGDTPAGQSRADNERADRVLRDRWGSQATEMELARAAFRASPLFHTIRPRHSRADACTRISRILRWRSAGCTSIAPQVHGFHPSRVPQRHRTMQTGGPAPDRPCAGDSGRRGFCCSHCAP